MAIALALGSCGGDENRARAPADASDPPVRPPPGWRTVTNATAAFTVAAPRSWKATARRGNTQIRSDDRLVSVTFSADRSQQGRRLAAARYARDTIQGLPGFDGTVRRRTRPVRGSPYTSARVEGDGVVRTGFRPLRITVAVFKPRGRTTYTAVVFRNAAVRSRFHDRRIDRMLRSFRAGRRAGRSQRRSG